VGRSRPVRNALSRGRRLCEVHWPALIAVDFFTTEVWRMRGLVTYYTAFIIELLWRRVHAPRTIPATTPIVAG